MRDERVLLVIKHHFPPKNNWREVLQTQSGHRTSTHSTTVHLTSIGNPLIEGAYFSAFMMATTKLNSLYNPPLSEGLYKLSPLSTPWAGAKK